MFEPTPPPRSELREPLFLAEDLRSPPAARIRRKSVRPIHSEGNPLLGSLALFLGKPRRGPKLWRRSRPALLLALAFLSGWGLLVVLEELSGSRIGSREAPSVEGPAALLILGREWPSARQDLLLEALSEVDRGLEQSGERWDLRWLRSLILEGLGRVAEASRELEAVPGPIRSRLEAAGGSKLEGDGLPGAPAGIEPLAALGAISRGRSRAVAGLAHAQEGAGAKPALLETMVAGGLSRGSRLEPSRRLLRSGDLGVRLLGAVWGTQAGDPAARSALGQLPLDGAGASRLLVELGEEDLFLKRARPGRLDLAPIRIQLLARRGEREAARRLAEELIATAPDSFELRLAAARLEREAKEPARAVDHLRAAALARPLSPEPMREWLRLASDFPERSDLLLSSAELLLRRPSAAERTPSARGERPKAGDTPVPAPDGFGLPEEEGAATRALATPPAAARARAAWGSFLAGDRDRAEAIIAAEPPSRSGEGAAEEPLVRALLALERSDFDLGEGWLGIAAREEPTDPRPWFLRGYLRLLSGRALEADRDWSEVLLLSMGSDGGRGDAPFEREAILEAEAFPFELALIHASRGDSAAARSFASLGPSRVRSLLGSFFRSAALAAAGDWPRAEAEALAYRARRFPVLSWQGRDPWVGPLFRRSGDPEGGVAGIGGL
jgi:tetratricopeptide (TPR) repeat protein